MEEWAQPDAGAGPAPAVLPAPPPYEPYGVSPAPGRHRRHRLTRTWVLLLVALAVVVADGLVVADRRGGSNLPLSVAVERRLVTESPRDAQRRADRRDAAIDAIFARRATAIRRRDRAAFLADLDPTQRAFVTEQNVVFDSLAKLRFARWYYQLGEESYSPGSIDFAHYGDVADLWLPVLTLRYQLAGFDTGEVGRRVVYTVVRRGSRWYIGSDTDLEQITSSGTSVRVDPWENGPILVSRSAHGIVIGHPEDKRAIASIRRVVEDAVRHVLAYVGRKGWNHKVVVVLPTDQDELNRVLANPTTFYDFSAIAQPLFPAPNSGPISGSRVVINPDGFDADSPFTTHLIRHEMTHVAMFSRVGPLTPKWLVEGLAEYVGNAGSDLAPDVLADSLAEAVASKGVPATLPTDSDFGLIDDAGVAYNSAWLLCRYIVSRYGRAALFRFHDAMSTPTGLDHPSDKLPHVLRTVLHTTEDELLRGWRPYVRAAVADLTSLLLAPGAAYHGVETGRIEVSVIAKQKGLDAARFRAAGVERAAVGLWDDGPGSAPRRRVVTSLLVSDTESGAAAAEKALADRLRPYDAYGRTIPHGRLFYVGTTIGGRHYNETIAVLRAGTVVIEVRTAVPGAGDSGGETRRIAAAQYAKVA